MAICQRSLPEALTRDQWLKVLACYQGCPAFPHRRERRSSQRNWLPALATISFTSDPNSGKQTVYPNCQIIDASAEGLAICTIRKIAPDTPLSIDVKVGGRRLLLKGSVRHSTGFPGSSVRVGVSLIFTEATSDQGKTGDTPGPARGG